MANSDDAFDSDFFPIPEGAKRVDGPEHADSKVTRRNPETGELESIYYAWPEDEKRQIEEDNRFQIEAMEERLRREETFNARYGYPDTPKYQDMMRLRRLCLWMKYICRYLDDAERVDAFDWARGDAYVSAAVSGPKSEWDREMFVHKNYSHTWSCAFQASSEVANLSGIPAVMEARVCLHALTDLLHPEVPDPTDWDREKSPADLERNLVCARTLLRTPLALAMSHVILTRNQLTEELLPKNPPCDPVVKSVAPSHLGLKIDFERRTIRREGHDAVVDLASKRALWETFRVFYAAENEDAPAEAWRNALSGDWSSSRTHRSRLRSELAALAITIPDRGRRLVHDGS